MGRQGQRAEALLVLGALAACSAPPVQDLSHDSLALVAPSASLTAEPTAEPPTCADLRGFARWRAWARRQDGDLAATLGSVRVCVVCTNNTASKVVEAVLRRAADAGPLRLQVSSRLLGGGNAAWSEAGSWENRGLEGRSLHHGRPPDPELVAAAAARGLALEGYSKPMTREDIDESHVLVALGDDAPLLVSAAAHAWGGDELRDHARSITAHITGDSIPATCAWRRGAGGAAADSLVVEAEFIGQRLLQTRLPALRGLTMNVHQRGTAQFVSPAPVSDSGVRSGMNVM